MTVATPPRRSAEEQGRVDAALIELFEQRIVFNQTLGLKVLSVLPGDVRAEFPMRHELIGHAGYGRLHGGVISAVLDAMGGLALMVAIGEAHAHANTLQVMQHFMKLATIDLRVDFLRQGLGERFVATAEHTRLGSRVGNALMKLHDDRGTLLATGAAVYAVA
jgi:uncharacterized protein (TIGR00369 family)